MSETFEVGQKVRTDDGEDGEITYGPFSSTYGTYTGYVVRTDAGERLQRAHALVAIPEPPTFAVGDKVLAGWMEKYAANIVAGPFISRAGDGTFYIVEDETGKHGFPTEAVLTKVVEPEPIKVGDKVRVVKDDSWSRIGEFVGKTGVITVVHGSGALPYRVKFDADQSAPYPTWNVAEVERITDEPIKVGDRVRILRATYAEHTHGREGVVTSTAGTFRAERGDTHPYDVSVGGSTGVVHVAEVERITDEPADTFTHDGETYDLTATYKDRDGDTWRFGRFGDTVRAEAYGDQPDHNSQRATDVVEQWAPFTRV